jgi:K+-transporting ATPase KdpF subunit
MARTVPGRRWRPGPFRARKIMSAVTIFLAGLFSAVLFVYLFYALIKPERF